MCGIAGIKYKNGRGPVGADLLEMLTGINHRGPDSAGLGLYSNGLKPDELKMRLRFDLPEGDPRAAAGLDLLNDMLARRGGEVLAVDPACDAYRLTFRFGGDLQALAAELLAIDHIEIQSMGTSLEITKAVGLCQELDNRFDVTQVSGPHGIGHVRLATESQILVSTCHPFWAFGFADVAVVHNGQLTNYYKLRRWLETRGWRFTTGNDTELIAIYVADKLRDGLSLEETLAQSLKDFDGTFSCIVSTADQIGFAKDMLGAKPLVVAETDDKILLASEEVGIQRVVHDPSLRTVEPYPLEIAVW